MDGDSSAAGELAALRTEIEELRREVRDLRPHSHSLRPTRKEEPQRSRARVVIHTLETDPDTQYKVHRWGAIYWLLNFPVIIWLFFFHQDLWLKVGIFITLIYSIYANLATDYGAMSSALAAKGMQPLPEIPLADD